MEDAQQNNSEKTVLEIDIKRAVGDRPNAKPTIDPCNAASSSDILYNAHSPVNDRLFILPHLPP